MKWLLVMTLVLCGCDGEEAQAIRECGYACERAHRPMVKWSKADGCVCGEPAKEQR